MNREVCGLGKGNPSCMSPSVVRTGQPWPFPGCAWAGLSKLTVTRRKAGWHPDVSPRVWVSKWLCETGIHFTPCPRTAHSTGSNVSHFSTLFSNSSVRKGSLTPHLLPLSLLTSLSYFPLYDRMSVPVNSKWLQSPSSLCLHYNLSS